MPGMPKWSIWPSTGLLRNRRCRLGFRCGIQLRTIAGVARPEEFQRCVEKTRTKHQVYISLSNDPYLNLSIEHYLLQTTHPATRILFLYKNAPSVIIGRNQNPWLETNLRFLSYPGESARNVQLSEIGKINLVRRRSGGGAVFHDEGNLNYSVICPRDEFDRDKHAEMVVAALQKLGARGVHVNGRHDIVLDCNTQKKSLKISGSAYKLVRGRALHHGTCLLSTSHLELLHKLLHSPAHGYIISRGVESVKSPVGNVAMALKKVEASTILPSTRRQIVEEFVTMYKVLDREEIDKNITNEPDGFDIFQAKDFSMAWLDDSVKTLPQINQGFTELTSPEWIYGQTPQFEFSVSSRMHANESSPPPPKLSAVSTRITVKNDVILAGHVAMSADAQQAQEETEWSQKVLEKRRFSEIYDWNRILLDPSAPYADSSEVSKLSGWFNYLFGLS